jgi:hypothetical protein
LVRTDSGSSRRGLSHGAPLVHVWEVDNARAALR